MTTRVALVGAGRFGTLHLHAYQSLPAEIVAVCDPDHERLTVAQESFGVPAVYSTLQELFEHEPVDLVDIASDEASHAALTLQALAAGRSVFVEKPLSTSESDAEQIGAVARERGVPVIAGHVSRFGAGYQHLHNVLERGDLGRVQNLRFRRDFSRSWFAEFGRRAHPVWESGIHDIDLAIWYAGARCSQVYAVEQYTSGLHYPDTFVAVLTFTNGVVATIESAWLVPEAAPQTLDGALGLGGTIDATAELLGERGTATYRLAHDGLSVRTDTSTAHPELTLWPTVLGRVSGALVDELRYTIEVVDGSRANDVLPLDQTIESVRIAAAIQRSAQQGAPISLEAT